MDKFRQELERRILLLDGAMGTMIQQLGLEEKDFRGKLFANHPVDLKGNNDILCLSRPEAICDIHRRYIEADADIISTNSFNANSISQADYQTSDYVRDINLAAAHIARQAADEAGRKVWVAGSIGPTNRTASISPDVNDPASRNITYDELFEAYAEQASALIEGSCDILLFETVFDTLNLKAGLDAAAQTFRRLGRRLPVMVSATIAGPSGRILSGQTIEALWVSVASYSDIVSFGLNCSWGADLMRPYIAEAAKTADVYISCHPNAGLPDELGNYKESAEQFATHVEAFLRDRSVNIVGGCCGTTPHHIACLREIAGKYEPHKLSSRKRSLYVAGLDALEISPDRNFVNIGERCNVAGSRKFLRLIKEKSYDEALSIARRQVSDGAQVLDINMDDAMLDARAEMTHFINLIGSDPEVASVPLMIDSSQWDVVESALKCVQGKCIVNSISLKEGEEAFLAKARCVRRHNAALVVMAFDEKGQADTYERKIEICGRAYRLLVDKVGFEPHDIIFDPNIMAVATGIESHNLYARDFIRAVKWIKAELPGAKVSGGVSNLSFAFRGHNRLRESIHAVFLYHAIAAGLDMAIINPSSSVTYNDVEPELRQLISDLVLNGSNEASAALCDYATADNLSQSDRPVEKSATERKSVPVAERLCNAIVRGDSDFLSEDIAEALLSYSRAIDIIEGPLMDGVNTVGKLFGEGKIFLPQVIKTARVMKQAVDLLKPRINAEKSADQASSAGKILFATVKGDVHDIGKNIVSIVLECNNYEVIDLGVMVPAEHIVAEAQRLKPDIICLSGLITPSLGEMVNVADKLEEAGLDIPLIVGGATTSKIHTALHIAPHLSAPVVHASDASRNPVIASRLLNPALRSEFVKELDDEYRRLRSGYKKAQLLPYAEAIKHRLNIDWTAYRAPKPKHQGVSILDNISISEIKPFINWRMFYNAWRVSAHADDVSAQSLFDDAQAMLSKLETAAVPLIRAAVGVFEAASLGEDIIIGGMTMPMLRRQLPNDEGICRSLADFVMPAMPDGRCRDYAGTFVVSVGAADNSIYSQVGIDDDTYSTVLLRTLLDRLAEASSEWLHRYVRTEYWGYASDEAADMDEIFKGNFRGIRPAVGYPMMPEQTIIHSLGKLLPFESVGVSLTENGAMSPASSVCGLYIAHPDARYFMLEQIGEDQLADYARRRGVDIERMRSVLLKNLL